MSVEAIDTRYEMYERRHVLSGLLPGLPPIGRLGVAILAIGWILILFEPVMVGHVPQALQGIVSRIGQSAIMTGAGLAVLGLLMTMIVNRNETGVLSHPTGPADTTQVVAPPPAAVPVGVAAAVAAPAAAPSSAAASQAAQFAQASPVAAPVVSAPPLPTLSVEPQFEPQARAVEPAVAFVRPTADSSAKVSNSVTLPISGSMVVVARGQVDDRCFLVLSDGSMVIETLLGQRRFRSLDDARDFIGGGNFVLHDTVNIPLKPAGAGESAPRAASRVLRHV